jgi:cell division septum initiation protein DivIVA
MLNDLNDQIKKLKENEKKLKEKNTSLEEQLFFERQGSSINSSKIE